MKNFRKRIFLKHHSVFQWNVLVQPDKNFSAENRDTALLSIKIFPYQNFSETQNGFLANFFRSCEIKKFFWQNRGASPSFAWNFVIPEFFRTTEGSIYECYRLCETRIFQRNLVISPVQKIFRYTNFSETRKCSPTKFSGTVTDTKFSTEKHDTPSSLMHKIFWYPKFSDTPKCSPKKFFGTVRQKILNENSLLHEI